MQNVDLNEFSKEELYDVAQRLKRKYQKLKESIATDGERERENLMLALAANAGDLASVCANGIRSDGGNCKPGPFHEEIDRLVRGITAIHKRLLVNRGETVMSKGMLDDG